MRMTRSVGMAYAADAIDRLADDLEKSDTNYLLCPLPELKGKYGVVMFFDKPSDADELVWAVREATPT